MTVLRLCAILLLILTCGVTTSLGQSYKDASLPVDARVQDLLARMTPEEKFWQLFMLAGGLEEGVEKYTNGAFGFQVGLAADSLPAATVVNRLQRHFIEKTRLGIPIIPFAEALHGLVQKGATSYPQAIALAATFDTSLMRDVASAIAVECRRQGIRQVLSPVVNIASDVRWGRVEETYGEDPFLSSAMAVSFVSEFERRGIITTPKHFIANVGDGGRDSYPIEISERLLREIHLPPFEACIRLGGSRSIMTSYNSYNGSPCSASDWLLNRLLKDELKFPGFIISDAGAVGGANVLHFTAADYAQSGEHAINSGLDVIFQTAYDHHTLFMPPFLDSRIPAEVIDSAVARVLRAKFELGLFDKPYVDETAVDLSARREVDRQLARQAAQKSIVLLKNKGGALPLSENLKTIAVIGPDAAEVRLGGYSGPGNKPVTILEGITRRAGERVHVRYARGCSRTDTQFVTIPSEYLSCVSEDSVRRGLLGSYFDNINMMGLPVFTRVDPRVDFQWTLFSPDQARLPYDCYSVRWTGQLTVPATGRFRIGIDGTDGYRLYIDDSLVIDNHRNVSARTRTAAYPVVKDHQYNIRIEYSESSGNARLRLIWDINTPSDDDRQLAGAVALASASDVAVLVVGIEEGEFRDRASLALPGRQEELIRRVAATGRPTVVVIVGGSAVTMGNWIDSVAAVIDVWYPGEAGGDAVADVLFGDVNPAGRLPITFPLSEGQLPLTYNHKPTGRGDDYADLTGRPLFPFGYGLSYTEFEYSDLTFDRSSYSVGDTVVIRFNLRNIGKREGDEVVQLYIRDLLASVARPVKELKDFRRVHLEPGENIALSFAVTPDELSMLDRELKRVVESGDFRIMIGASSADIRLHGIVTVTH